jgi:hypothetical protein
MLRIVGLCLALLLTTANTALADEWWEEIERGGFVAGLSASVGGMLDIKDLETPLIEIDEDVSAGFHLKTGYRLPRWLQGDLHLEYLSQRLDVRGGNLSPDPEDRVMTFTGDAKFILPRWANAEFYLLAGVGMINVDRESSFAARFGGGIDFYFSRSIGMNWGVSYVRVPEGTLDEWDYVTADIGLFYRFDLF